MILLARNGQHKLMRWDNNSYLEASNRTTMAIIRDIRMGREDTLTRTNKGQMSMDEVEVMEEEPRQIKI